MAAEWTGYIISIDNFTMRILGGKTNFLFNTIDRNIFHFGFAFLHRIQPKERLRKIHIQRLIIESFLLLYAINVTFASKLFVPSPSDGYW